MPKRLLCCSSSLDGGGSERQLWMLACGIDPDRFSAEIYLTYRTGPYLSKVPERIPIHSFAEHPSVGIQKKNLYLPGSIHRAQVQYLVNTLESRKIDLVYDRTFHMTLVTAEACRRRRTPRVSVVVNPPSLDFTARTERFLWLKKRLLARAYRDPLCTVVTVSEHVTDDMVATFPGLDRQRIRTIRSPIDIEQVEQAAAEQSIWSSLGQADLRVVIVGRLSPQKFQSLAFEALVLAKKERPTAKIVLALVGEGPDQEMLRHQSVALEIADRVHFLGFQSNPYPLIREADLLCLTSNYEGLPNVALEAMSLRTPVLATDSSGSIRELLGERQRGVLVDPGDALALANEMLDRIDHNSAWQERAEAGRHWIEAHHNYSQWLNRMAELFEQRLQSRQDGQS